MADTRATGKRRIMYSGYVASPSAADSQDGFYIPFASAHLAFFGYALDVGGSSGTTSVQLNRVRNETDTELLAATLDIANDATEVFNNTNSFQNNQLQQGDFVRIDVDALAGGGAAGLAWAVEIHVDQN